jgi:hypothetical protein
MGSFVAKMIECGLLKTTTIIDAFTRIDRMNFMPSKLE